VDKVSTDDELEVTPTTRGCKRKFAWWRKWSR